MAPEGFGLGAASASRNVESMMRTAGKRFGADRSEGKHYPPTQARAGGQNLILGLEPRAKMVTARTRKERHSVCIARGLSTHLK